MYGMRRRSYLYDSCLGHVDPKHQTGEIHTDHAKGVKQKTCSGELRSSTLLAWKSKIAREEHHAEIAGEERMLHSATYFACRKLHICLQGKRTLESEEDMHLLWL
jgi:hypothetical protein